MDKLDNVIVFTKEQILVEFNKFMKDFMIDTVNDSANNELYESIENIYHTFNEYKNNYKKLVEFMDENRYFVNLCARKKIKRPNAILLDLGDNTYMNTFNDDEQCNQEWSDFSSMNNKLIKLRNKQ